jgi:hypothetical protein
MSGVDWQLMGTQVRPLLLFSPFCLLSVYHDGRFLTNRSALDIAGEEAEGSVCQLNPGLLMSAFIYIFFLGSLAHLRVKSGGVAG